MEITREIAQRIIESRPVIDEMLTPFKGVEVSHVGFTDRHGDAFEWENGDEYAIVSFKAMSEYGFDRAVEDFNDEEYTDACNHTLSMSMDVEKARDLIGAVGVLTCHKIENKDGEMITVVKSFKAVAPANASSKTRTLDSVGGKKKGIKLAEAVEEPKAKKKDKKDKKEKSK